MPIKHYRATFFFILLLFLTIGSSAANDYEAMNIPELQEFANNNDQIAQYHLALRFNIGQHVARDPVTAVYWLRKAAKQGHLLAQEQLALALINGNGVGKDSLEGFRWAITAAEQGLASSQYLVAGLYEQGAGVRQNLAKAFHYYSQSAAQGNTKAMIKQAEMLLYGEGVKKNVYLALQVYQKAAEAGDQYAIKQLPDLLDHKLCYFSSVTTLFKKYLRCVTAPEFHKALISRGVRLTERKDKYTLSYDSSALFANSRLELGQTHERQIARLVYSFPYKNGKGDALLEEWVGRLKLKYSTSNKQVNNNKYIWQLKDKIEITLEQNPASSEVYLSYIMPDRVKAYLELQQKERARIIIQDKQIIFDGF